MREEKERRADEPMPDDSRRAVVMRTAAEAGLLGGTRDETIGSRVPGRLVERAKARAGMRSDTELLLYALANVALEDDFGRRLVARKGRVARDVPLEA
jgi:hypothetical protein